MPRFLFLLAALLAFSGCAVSRVDYTPSPSEAHASAADIAAGENLFPIVEAGLWGYIDRTGAVVIAPRYEQAMSFSEGRAAVREDGRWGYLTPAGMWVVEPEYATAADFSDGRALVSTKRGKERRFGYLDASGAEVVPTVLPYALSYSEGLALARLTTGDRTSFQALLAKLGALPDATGYRLPRP